MRHNAKGEPMVRLALSRADEVYLDVPRKNAALALISDAEVGATPDKWYRIFVPDAWANGDDLEVILRRIPMSQADSESPAVRDLARRKAVELLRVLAEPGPVARDIAMGFEVKVDNARVRALELVELLGGGDVP